ncbi:hypothetical protein ACHAXM_000718 [Skeletonema potamos]
MAKKKSTMAAASAKPKTRSGSSSSSSKSSSHKFALIISAALFVAFIALCSIDGVNFESLLPGRAFQKRRTTTLTQPATGDLFLNWFTANGGVFHPISHDGGDIGVQITIQKFEGMGWGLAAIVNKTSSTIAASSTSGSDNNVCSSNNSRHTAAASSSSSSGDEKDDDRSCSAQQQHPITNSTTLVIPHLAPLFTIPSKLIISISSILNTYSSPSSSRSSYYLPNFYPVVNKVLLSSFPHGVGLAKMSTHNGVRMGLVEQDVVIAMMLLTEDCLHHHGGGGSNSNSFWGPYLDMLPSTPIPRLDTFEDEDYVMLNDDNLEMVGRSSKQRLKDMFFGNNRKGDDDDGYDDSLSIRAVVRDMIQIQLNNNNNKPPSTTTTIKTRHDAVQVPQTCLRFDTFHKFIGIVSSRAMVLKGIKYLSPLAEMINYSPISSPEEVIPRSSGSSSDENDHHTTILGKDSEIIRTPFDLYHTIGADDSITVRSDRNVMIHHHHQQQQQQPLYDDAATDDMTTTTTTTTTTTIQIFEDYGPVDSSLFLEMHAFVPSNNPNNCAVIHGVHFLRRQIAPGRSDPNSTMLLRALKALHLTNNPQSTQFVSLEDVCVRTNLSIVDDGNLIGRRPASDAIAITSLLLGESSEIFTNLELLKSKCITAIESNDIERIELQCARYPGSRNVVKHALVNAAKRSVEMNDAVTMETLLSWLAETEKTEGVGGGKKEKLALALRFRIEERKILESISNSTNLMIDDESTKHTVVVEASDDDLDAKISAFNIFIDSLDLPVNNIRAQAVEGMRLGTVATKDLESEEAYITLPPHAVIDAVTALDDANISSPRLAALLKKLDSQQSDGFDVLIVYLLHERFVRKDQSKWWPYLDLLPTVEDVRSYHPLFFEEDEMNLYLGGSDVRKFILRSQRRAFERHAALASDVEVHDVLGSNVILDKRIVYWATAILDSRSIWWNGRRHLCPLLDLVNADTIGRSHETKKEESFAVTRASRPVKRGEQVFENYQQPNYLLFAFHGFLLENNPSDCALLMGSSINHNDPGAKYQYASRLQSSPTFCISGSNVDSMEELAKLLRMKHGLVTNKSESEPWLNEDVAPYLAQVLEERVARLRDGDESLTVTELEDKSILQRRRLMSRVVRSDLAHFQGALDYLMMKKKST